MCCVGSMSQFYMHIPLSFKVEEIIQYFVFWTRSWQDVLGTTSCDKVCHWLTAGLWFSPDTPVFSTNNTDHHDIRVTEIFLKVALHTIYLTLTYFLDMLFTENHHMIYGITWYYLEHICSQLYQQSISITSVYCSCININKNISLKLQNTKAGSCSCWTGIYCRYIWQQWLPVLGVILS